MRYPASKYGLSAVRLPNQIHPGTNVMDRTEMRKIQVAFGNRFARPRVGNLGFEIVEFALIAQTQLVNEDRRIFVGVRIVGRIIYASTTQSLRWARTIARRYSSGERPLLLASAARGRVQSNTFNRADFCKAGLAQDEARFAVSSGRALLLRHVRNLSHIFLFATLSG